MIGIEPLKDFFGVRMTHPRFPGNAVRFRIPECWFTGMLPVEPRRDLKRTGWQPNRRFPFDVLGPGENDWTPWQRQAAGSWVGHVAVEGWWSNEVTVTPADDHVRVHVRMTNDSQWDYTELWAHFCANTDEAPSFRDLTAERTIVFLEDGPRPVNRTHKYEGVGWRHICNTYVPIGREMRVKEYLYGCPISLDRTASPLTVRKSDDDRALIGVCFRHCYGLFYDCHERNSCLHSEPYIGDLEAGQTREVVGHFYWFEGDLADVSAKARQLDRAWVPGV